MSFFSDLKNDASIQESKDSVGGGFSPRPSGVYPATIKIVYADTTKDGAKTLSIICSLEDDTEYKETLYLTDNTGKHFYTSDDGKKSYRHGYVIADSLASLTTGYSLADQDTEQKVVNVYNFEQQKEVPTQVACLTALHDKKVILGIHLQQTIKKKKEGNTWVDTNEVKQQNVIDKVFHAESGKTVNEFKAKAENADFIETWKSKWTGQVVDKTKGKATNTGTSGAPKAAASKPTSSLFT